MGLFNKIFKKKKKKDKNENQVEVSEPTNLKGSEFSQQCLAENKNFANNGMYNRFDSQNESHYVEKSCYSSPPQREYSDYHQPEVFRNGMYNRQNENACYEGRIEQSRRNFEMSRPLTETNQRNCDADGLSYRHHYSGSSNDFRQGYDKERKYYTSAGERFECNNTSSESRKDLSRKMTDFNDFLDRSSSKKGSSSNIVSNVKMRPRRQRHQSIPERQSMHYNDFKDARNFSNKCSVDDVNRPANFQQHTFNNADFQFLKPPTYEESKSNSLDKSNHSKKFNITRNLLREDKVQPANIPVESAFENQPISQALRGFSNSVNRQKSFGKFVGQKVLPDIQEVHHKEKPLQNVQERFYVNKNNTNNNVENLCSNGDQFSRDQYGFQNTSKSNSGKNDCQQVLEKKMESINETLQKILSSNSNSEPQTLLKNSSIISTLVDSHLPTLGNKYENLKNPNSFAHLNENQNVVKVRKEENLTEDKDFCKVNFEQLQSVCREHNWKINKKMLIGEGGLARVFTG